MTYPTSDPAPLAELLVGAGVPDSAIQVVTAAQRGDAGAIAVNAAVKARLNPGPGAYGGLDVGDRIVVTAALARAVREVQPTPRQTRLAGLLLGR